MATVVIPKHGALGKGFTKAEKLKAIEHPGRQTNPKRGYQSAVAWISDLIALRKIIILCGFCRVKFNPRRFGYRRVFIPDWTGKTDGYTVNGDCDSCKQFTGNVGGGTAFQPDEEYAKTHIDPVHARRASRAAARSMSTWRFLQHQKKNGR